MARRFSPIPSAGTSGQKFDDAWIPSLDAIEIWNRKTDGLKPGAEALELKHRTGLPAVVGVDFHSGKQIYPLDNLVDSGGGRSQEADIFAGLRKGRLVPCAFRRPLVDDANTVREDFALRLHGAAEALRRSAKLVLPRRSRR